MAGDTVITIIGSLGQDPELRFTPSGSAVCNFSVGSTPRSFNRQTNEWTDGETLWMRCSVWRDAAENCAETLTRGMRVVVTGRLKQRSWEDKDGTKRTVVEMDVDEVGPSLKYASAKVTKTTRSAGGGQDPGGYGGGGGYGNPAGGYASAPQQGQGQGDPWATGPSGGGNPLKGGYSAEEPPF